MVSNSHPTTPSGSQAEPLPSPQLSRMASFLRPFARTCTANSLEQRPQKPLLAAIALLIMTSLMSINATGTGDSTDQNTANQHEPHEAIMDSARSFLVRESAELHQGATTEITLTPLDPRLRLPLCTIPLSAYLPSGGRLIGSTSVGVSCEGERRWSLYVSARIAIHGDVVVAAKPIAKGARLESEDLTTARRDLSRVARDHYTFPEDVVGMVTRRRLANGALITPGSLKVVEEVDVLVATRSLARDEFIRAGDVSTETRDDRRLPSGYLTRPEEAVGSIATRTISSGDIITLDQIDQANFIHVLATTRSLAAGSRLAGGDIGTVRRNADELPTGYLTDPKEVEGMMTSRTLSPDTIITLSMLKPAPVIEKDDHVTLLVDLGGLQVRAEGVALESGALGERIRVRNRSSNRVIEGEVVANGVVSIQP
jgi:flagella basal body P-ring formation protein FlgA